MTTMDDDVLDYEALVEEYNASLAAVLRHHQSASALEAWVPDEDPFKSILNMVEAAEMIGRPSLRLRIGPATCAQLDLDALEAAIAPLGRVHIERANGTAVLQPLAIAGFPTTLILDKEGRLRGRLEGPAAWSGAAETIRQLMG